MKNIDSAINQHNSWRSKSKLIHKFNKEHRDTHVGYVHDVELCGHIVDEYVSSRFSDFEKTISEKALKHSQLENPRIGVHSKNKGSGLKTIGHLYTLALGRTADKFGNDAVLREFGKLPRSVINKQEVKEFFQMEFRNIIEELINL